MRLRRHTRVCCRHRVTKSDYFFADDCDEVRVPGVDIGSVIADGLTNWNSLNYREVLSLKKHRVQAFHQRRQIA